MVALPPPELECAMTFASGVDVRLGSLRHAHCGGAPRADVQRAPRYLP